MIGRIGKICIYMTCALAGVSPAVAQDIIYVCVKDGRELMTDRPCEVLGATTKRIRTPESFTPLSVIGGGLTTGERRMLREYEARNDALDREHEARRLADREAANRADALNVAECRRLDAVKKSIVNQQRQHSTQWLTDRHREINDEMYRRRCKTL
ncbi:MAG: hypothetical protein H3C26_12385 [Rhodocyclaceae bacterium]|nr:hypothetical protein [Rhodocyclaceae bacterium]